MQLHSHITSPVIVSTAYLPNLDYFKLLLQGRPVYIEKHEHFIKQTYRNRCIIYSANGPLTLSIPLVKQQDKERITDKLISYQEDWQKQHWRAITSAYKNSPYFEYFEDELKPFYEKQYAHLLDYNLNLTETLLKILRQKVDLHFTEDYQKDYPDDLDAREILHPKKTPLYQHPAYYQVFSNKHGFIPNLSVIDLIFNEGMNAVKYLKD